MPTIYDIYGQESGLLTAATLSTTEFDAISVGASAALTSVTTGRGSGNYALQASTGASSVVAYGERDWGVDLNTICAEIYKKFTAVPSAVTSFLTLTDPAGVSIADLRVNASGNFALYNYGNGSLYTSTGPVIRAGEWYQIQVKMLAHALAGTIDWRTWGVAEPGISGLTGLNTKPGGAFRKYRLGVTVAQANAGARQIDDVIIADDWIGNGVVTVMRPISNAIANWTVVDSGKESWRVLGDIPWASLTTDLIRSTTANQEERYNLKALASDLSGGTILGICPVIRHRRGVAGSAAAVNVSIRSGSTDGAAVSVDAGNTTYLTKRGATLALDPATGLPWTLDGLNAAQLKLVHDSGSNSCDVNAAFAYIAYQRGNEAALADVLSGDKLGRRYGVVPGAGRIEDYQIQRGRRR